MYFPLFSLLFLGLLYSTNGQFPRFSRRPIQPFMRPPPFLRFRRPNFFDPRRSPFSPFQSSLRNAVRPQRRQIWGRRNIAQGIPGRGTSERNSLSNRSPSNARTFNGQTFSSQQRPSQSSQWPTTNTRRRDNNFVSPPFGAIPSQSFPRFSQSNQNTASQADQRRRSNVPQPNSFARQFANFQQRGQQSLQPNRNIQSFPRDPFARLDQARNPQSNARQTNTRQPSQPQQPTNAQRQQWLALQRQQQQLRELIRRQQLLQQQQRQQQQQQEQSQDLRLPPQPPLPPQPAQETQTQAPWPPAREQSSSIFSSGNVNIIDSLPPSPSQSGSKSSSTSVNTNPTEHVFDGRHLSTQDVLDLFGNQGSQHTSETANSADQIPATEIAQTLITIKDDQGNVIAERLFDEGANNDAIIEQYVSEVSANYTNSLNKATAEKLATAPSGSQTSEPAAASSVPSSSQSSSVQEPKTSAPSVPESPFDPRYRSPVMWQTGQSSLFRDFLQDPARFKPVGAQV